MLDLLVDGAVLLSGHNQYRPFVGTVAVQADTIVWVGPADQAPEKAKVHVDGRGKILMPGLINAHCHGDMAFARGLGDGMTLQQQMQKFAKNNWFYDQLTRQDRFFARQHTYGENLLAGTTCILENMFWSLGDLSQKAAREMGIRAALAEDVRYDFQKGELLSPGEIHCFAQACRAQGCLPVLGSVSEEDFSAPMLQQIAQLAAGFSGKVTCHLAETTWRLALCQEKMGTTPVQALDQFGLVDENLIGSHGVWLTPQEMEILAARGASIVSTPLCELKIADGLAPIPQLLAAGVNVALGTDGAMWNNSNDLFREMKCTALAHCVQQGPNAIPHKKVLDMATINGAKALGLGHRLGTLEKGKLADFILLDATRPHMGPLRLGERENVSSAVAFCATGRDVSDVFVGGRQLVQEGRLLHTDMARIQQEVQRTAEKMETACGVSKA